MDRMADGWSAPYNLGSPVNSDAPEYGGSGQGNFGGVDADLVPMHGKMHSLSVTVPPLGMVVFKRSN